MAVNRAVRAFIPVKKAGESRRTFNHIKFDADGKFLVLHHYGASWYYKANLIFLGMFYGASLYNYVVNSQVFFGKEWFGKAYLGMVTFSIFGLWSFSHRQIKAIHLLKGGKEVSIETFTNFGLTYNRPKVLPVQCLEGNRVFLASSMNLYQLEYSYKSSWANLTKRRSFFYRPEYISNFDLWKAIRNGSEIDAVENDEA